MELSIQTQQTGVINVMAYILNVSAYLFGVTL